MWWVLFWEKGTALMKNKQEISPPCAMCKTRHCSPGLLISVPAVTRNLMVRKKQPGLREAAKQRMMQQQMTQFPSAFRQMK